MARAACECLETGFVLVAGEIHRLLRCVFHAVGGIPSRDRLYRANLVSMQIHAVLTAIEDQSPDIALGVICA